MADQKRKYVVKKKLTIAKTYRAWDNWAVGDIMVGKVVGIHEDMKYDKQSPIINVEEAFLKKDKAKDYIGKNVVLNYCGQLAKNYPEITVGDVLQVEYTGKGVIQGKSKYAGKEAHSVQVDLMGEIGDDEELEEADEEDDGL